MGQTMAEKILERHAISGQIEPGRIIRARVDIESGLVAVAGQRFSAQPVPPFLQELIHAGGLVAWVRGTRARRQTA